MRLVICLLLILFDQLYAQVAPNTEWFFDFTKGEWKGLTESIQKFLLSDAAKLHQLDPGDECAKSFAEFAFDLYRKKQYTLRALDSYGKPASGTLLGDTQWNGQYLECVRIINDKFKGKWCSIQIGAQFRVYGELKRGLSIGICVPDTCTAEYFIERLKTLENITKIEWSADCPMLPKNWNAGEITSLVVTCILASLAIIGTIVHWYFEWKAKKEQQLFSISSDGLLHSVPDESYKSGLAKVALMFSIQRNSTKLVHTEDNPSHIRCLHGIRFFSIAWITVSHAYYSINWITGNIVEYSYEVAQHIFMQTMANGDSAVDTFFMMSGLLAAYHGLKHMNKTGGKLKIWQMYLHRYIRLTPVFAFFTLMLVGFVNRAFNGPYWPAYVKTREEPCSKNWWTHLLYINNIYPVEPGDRCSPVAWYLANDFQFFLLSPIFLYLYYRKRWYGITAILLTMLASMMATGFVAAEYDHQPSALQFAIDSKPMIDTFFTGNGSGGLEPMKSLGHAATFGTDIYCQPWFHMSPYLVGILLGFWLQEYNGKIKMNTFYCVLGWLISAVLCLAVLYGLWPNTRDGIPLPTQLSAFYSAMRRPVWALGVGWVIVACHTGYGGPVDTILGWKVFVPLGRLTFAAYLLNGTITVIYLATLDRLLQFSHPTVIFMALGTLVLSFGIGYFFWILVESPFANLQSLLIPKRRHIEETNQDNDATEE